MTALGHRQTRRLAAALTAVLTPTLLWSAEPPADLLRRSQQILTEEQRQHYVAQQLDGTVKHFRELIDDLASNGLLQNGPADEMRKAIGVLEVVVGDHVKKAREHLRQARKQLDNPDHLKSADREIDSALQKLNALLKLVGALEKNELVREQLRQIIRDQENLNAATKDVGKQLLEGTLKSPTAPLKAVSGTQQGIAQRVGKLPEALKEAAKAAEPDEQKLLEKAAEALQQKQVAGQLNAAARNLENRSVVEAVMQQKQALDALKEIARMLEAGANDPAKQQALAEAQQVQLMAQAAQSLMQQQQQLMNQTQAAPAQGLPQLAQPQNNLGQQAQAPAGQMNPQAAQAMQQAAKNMQAAAQALKQGQQPQAMGQQKQAMANLQKAAQAQMAQAGQGTQAAMRQGQGMGQGQGLGQGMGMGIGTGMGTGAAMALAMNSQQGFNPQEGNRMFSKTAPVDAAINRDRSTWTPLGMRERGAINERYIKELPLEYRELLKAYYEALAK